MNIRLSLLVTLALILLAGCQPQDVSEPVDATLPPTPRAQVGPVEMAGTAPAPAAFKTPDPGAQKLILLAQEDLARILDVDVEQVRLLKAEAATWPDTSLGCPQPGMNYAEVITPGFQIILEANGQLFSYHKDDTNRVILCNSRPLHEIFIPP